MLLQVYRYAPSATPHPTYELVAREKLHVLKDMITETTRDLLFVDKITML